jgi:hypothetical protein
MNFRPTDADTPITFHFSPITLGFGFCKTTVLLSSLTLHRRAFCNLILFRESGVFGRVPAKILEAILAAQGNFLALIFDVHRFPNTSDLISGDRANRVRGLRTALGL